MTEAEQETQFQIKLELEVEPFADREKKIRRLLREFRTLDRRIEYYTNLANGNDLIHQPRVTAAPPIDDDPWIIAELAVSPLNDNEQEIVRVVSALMCPHDFRYATCFRVGRELAKFVSTEQRDEDIRKAFLALLQERVGEARLELTDVERQAIMREREIDDARQKLRTLTAQREHVGFALKTMQMFYPEAYTLLWNRYVLDKPRHEVCEVAGFIWPTQEKTFEYHLRQAMQNFAKFVPEHVLA